MATHTESGMPILTTKAVVAECLSFLKLIDEVTKLDSIKPNNANPCCAICNDMMEDIKRENPCVEKYIRTLISTIRVDEGTCSVITTGICRLYRMLEQQEEAYRKEL